MGTNYYLRKNVCDCCGRGSEELHIGKSSGGWCFALNTHPYEGITDLEQWKIAFTEDGTAIYDEYGVTIEPREMLSIIEDREWPYERKGVPIGYSSWNEFHTLNHSQSGPRGLLRHKVDGVHCIANGAGAYDIMAGEFS